MELEPVLIDIQNKECNQIYLINNVSLLQYPDVECADVGDILEMYGLALLRITTRGCSQMAAAMTMRPLVSVTLINLQESTA